MRLLIDLQSCQSGSKYGGIGRYSLALAKAMARHAGSHDVWLLLNNLIRDTQEDVVHAFEGLVPRDRFFVFEAPGPVAESLPDNQRRTRVAEYVREHFVAELRPDFVHVSSLIEGLNEDVVTSVGLLYPGRQSAVTLYDLIPLFEREKYLSAKIAETYYLQKISHLKNAGVLLAISDYSRQEGIDALGLESEQVANISSAASGFFRPRHVPPERRYLLENSFGINSPFVMYTSSFDQRKNQAGLIEAFSLLPQELRSGRQLVIVGNGWDGVYQPLRRHAERCGLAPQQLIFTGKIDDETLLDLYNLAELFVFPSLREGFGLPILEAMSCGTPAIGSNSTSIPEVIGRNDALFDPAVPEDIARKMAEVLGNSAFRSELRAHGLEYCRNFSWDRSAVLAWDAIVDAADRACLRNKHIIRPENRAVASLNGRGRYAALLSGIGNSGPHAPEQAAALVEPLAHSIASNLERARAFQDPVPRSAHWALVFCVRNQAMAKAFRQLFAQFRAAGQQASLIRPDAQSSESVHDSESPKNGIPDFLLCAGDLLGEPLPHTRNLIIYMEAGKNPSVEELDWLDTHASGVVCEGEFDRKRLIDRGLGIPILALRPLVPMPATTAPNFTGLEGVQGAILHVVSDPYADGTDVVLDALIRLKATATPAWRVIIAASSGARHSIEQLLKDRMDGMASTLDIRLVTIDETAQVLALLPLAALLLVPSRTFTAKPWIEAVTQAGTPVLITGGTAGAGFDMGNASSLIPLAYKVVVSRNMPQDPVLIMDPDIGDIMSKLSAQDADHSGGIPDDVLSNKFALLSDWFARDSVDRLAEFGRIVDSSALPTHVRIGFVSTWNTRCGIASYCEALANRPGLAPVIFAPHSDQRERPDQPWVRRCWRSEGSDDLSALGEAIRAAAVDVVVIQFNYSFFDFTALNDMTNRLLDDGIIVFLMLHSTNDIPHGPSRQLRVFGRALKRAHRVLVHSSIDANRLKAIDVIQNVQVFPHGVPVVAPKPVSFDRRRSFTLASYGFFLPGKGLHELIEAFALLAPAKNDFHLLMINAQYSEHHSKPYMDEALRRIGELGLAEHITLVTDYLALEESVGWLQHADLIVYPYQATGESSSAAVRIGLVSGKPVAVTPLNIFEDADAAVFRLPGITAEEMKEGISQLIDLIRANAPLVEETSARQRDWIEHHDFNRVSRSLHKLAYSAYVNAAIGRRLSASSGMGAETTN